MAQPYTTGPVHIYVNVSGGNPSNLAKGGRVAQGQNPKYLGTCLEAPKVRFSPKWSPLMNDLAGDQEPYDMAYQGQSADIFGDLTVYNWSILHRCKTRPNPAATEGVDGPGSVGTLMITEGFAYDIWLHYPYYQQKAAYSLNQAPAGYHFFAGWMIGPDEESPGTKPNQIHVQFHAMRYFDDGSFFLYDSNFAGIPERPPTGNLAT